MTDLRTAAQQALEALGLWAAGRDMDAVALNDLIHRLEAALAEPVQEPVAWRVYAEGETSAYVTDNPDDLVGAYRALPLYTAPPQRKPLDEDQMNEAYIYIWRNLPDGFEHTASGWIEVAIRYAERAHGITNPVVEEDKAPHPEDYEITVLRQQIATYQTALDDALRRKHGS